MNKYSESELKESIVKDYGFNYDLIKNPVLCGLWHIRFEVNGILYLGSSPYYGALPTLKVVGYTAKHFYQGTPITEEYYKRHIQGRKFRLLKVVDAEAGDWDDTGKRFDTEEQIQTYIEQQNNPSNWTYDIEL